MTGEVKFRPFGCDPWILEDFPQVHLESPDRELEVEYVRGTEKAPIVKFKSIDSRDDSELLNGAVIWIPEGSLPELEENAFYEADFLYARVMTPDGKELGEIREIIETGESDVLVIRGNDGQERLLSANKNVIQEVRKEDHAIVVNLPAEEE